MTNPIVKIPQFSSDSYSQNPSVKLVAIARDEGPYLAQWIFHHLDLGINEIEIWLNNSTDNSSDILSCIARHDGRVSFVEADAFYTACQTSKSRFQQSVYTLALDTARSAGKHTHMLFLDLDEYLLRLDMGQSISDLIRANGDFDVMSFLWYLDRPSSEHPFSDVLYESQEVYRNNHVKSMASLASKTAMKPLIHNFDPKGSSNIRNILPGGIELDKSNTSLKRQRVNLDSIPLVSSRPEDWFVYHKVHKSRIEYCISLMRGRGHVNITMPLKDNRTGYLTPKGLQGITLSFSSDAINQYNTRQKTFVEKLGLADRIAEAKHLYLGKYQHFQDLLNLNPALRQEFYRQLRGTGHESMPIASSQNTSKQAIEPQALLMPSKALRQSTKIKELFYIAQFKLFRQECAYVSCFGEPAAGSDGWILDLPASHVFGGDYHALPFETILDATWVHATTAVRDPLSRYLSHNEKTIPWAGKPVYVAGKRYEPADLFRDLASICNDAGQFLLARDFINQAHELRPQGPVIARMLAELNMKCRPDQ